MPRRPAPAAARGLRGRRGRGAGARRLRGRSGWRPRRGRCRVGRPGEDEELQRTLACRRDDVEQVSPCGTGRSTTTLTVPSSSWPAFSSGRRSSARRCAGRGGRSRLRGPAGRDSRRGRGGRAGRHLRERYAFGIDDLHPTGGQRLRGDGVRDVERGQPVDVLLSQSTGVQQLKIIELVDRWAELRQARCRGSHNRQFCHWLGVVRTGRWVVGRSRHHVGAGPGRDGDGDRAA